MVELCSAASPPDLVSSKHNQSSMATRQVCAWCCHILTLTESSVTYRQATVLILEVKVSFVNVNYEWYLIPLVFLLKGNVWKTWSL